jgi:hypothetical protein
MMPMAISSWMLSLLILLEFIITTLAIPFAKRIVVRYGLVAWNEDLRQFVPNEA